MAVNETDIALNHLGKLVGDAAKQEAILLAKLTSANAEIKDWRAKYEDLQRKFQEVSSKGGVDVVEEGPVERGSFPKPPQGDLPQEAPEGDNQPDKG